MKAHEMAKKTRSNRTVQRELKFCRWGSRRDLSRRWMMKNKERKEEDNRNIRPLILKEVKYIFFSRIHFICLKQIEEYGGRFKWKVSRRMTCDAECLQKGRLPD